MAALVPPNVETQPNIDPLIMAAPLTWGLRTMHNGDTIDVMAVLTQIGGARYFTTALGAAVVVTPSGQVIPCTIVGTVATIPTTPVLSHDFGYLVVLGR